MARSTKLGRGLFWRGEIIWARFSVAGHHYRLSCRTGTESIAAKRRERERQSVIDQTRYGQSGPVGWPNAILEWTRSPPPGVSVKTLAAYASSLGMLASLLDPLDVQSIDGAKLREIVNVRRRTVSLRTIKNDLTAISSVLDTAVDNNWVDTNVAHGFDRRRLRQAPHKIVLPHPESIAAVVAECPGSLADMTLLALETGLRQDELVQLGRTDCDLPRSQVTVYFGAKRDKVRVVTLTTTAKAIIRRQPVYLGCENLFWHDDGATYKEVSSRFLVITKRTAQKRTRAKASFRRFRFHDLRHLFAVEYLRSRRGSIYSLQAEMGHTSIKTTEIYLAYLSPDDAHAAREGIAQIASQEQQFEEKERVLKR